MSSSNTSSSGVETLGVLLSAEGLPEFSNGMAMAGKAVEDSGKKIDGAAPPLARTTAQMANSGNTAKQTAAAWRLLPAQITDVVTSLASGQPAWLIAIQQGGQIKDSFGGIGPMFTELGRAIGPVRLAMMGVAGAAGVVLLAHQQGASEARGYSNALIMNGNAAGTYAGEMTDMARAISQVVGTQGKAAESLTLMAESGEVARANLQEFSALGVRMERAFGQPLEDTARRFTELGREPLEASLRLNRGVNYLTASVYEQIRALMAEGRVVEAGAVAQKAYADAMSGRTAKVVENLGLLEQAWVGVKDAAKASWDEMLAIGRQDTLSQRIAKAKSDIERFNAMPNQGGGGLLGRMEEARYEKAKRTLELGNRDLLRQHEQGLESSGAVAAAQKELRDREAAAVEAGNAIQLAQAQAASTAFTQLAQQDMARAEQAATRRELLARRDLALTQAMSTQKQTALAREQATLEDARDRDAVSLNDYYERRASLERRRLQTQIDSVDEQIQAEWQLLDAQLVSVNSQVDGAAKVRKARLDGVDAQILAEQRRKPADQNAAQQQEARLIELHARRAEIMAEGETRQIELVGRRSQVEMDAERRMIELRAQRSAAEGEKRAAVVAAERERAAAAEAKERQFLSEFQQRRQALTQFSEQMRASNAAGTVELIADPYVRAAARARLEIDELTRYYDAKLTDIRSRRDLAASLDPDATAGLDAEILQAQQRKADAILLSERRLTEDLKPEWQRMLEGYRDTTRLMREAYDDFQSGWLRSGEQAWASYLQTGKLNLGSLKDFAIGQFAQMSYKRYLAEPMQQAGDAVAGMLGFKTFGGGDAAGLAAGTANTAAVTANTSARTAEVVALNLGTTALGNLASTASLAGAALATLGAQSGGGGAVALLGNLLGSFAGGNSSFSAVDVNGYGMTSGGQILPTRGGAAGGGNIMRGSLLEVNEEGPELLSVNGRTYLMMGGRDGYVTPSGGPGQAGGGSGGGSSVVLSPTIHIDSRSDKTEVMAMVQKAMQYAQAELLDRMERGRA